MFTGALQGAVVAWACMELLWPGWHGILRGYDALGPLDWITMLVLGVLSMMERVWTR